MKAYLVTFTATTRVVVSEETEKAFPLNLNNIIVNEASNQIIRNGVEDYLCIDNAEINPDTECPAGTFNEDKNLAI